MLVLLAGIVSLHKVEEITVPADVSVTSAPANLYSVMLSSIPVLPKKWTTSQRNQRTTSNGIGGQLRMERVDNFKRNDWTTSPGIRSRKHCCQRFEDCVIEKSIVHRGLEDETEWAAVGFYQLYYCPFCGKYIKGRGWGDYDKKHSTMGAR